MEKELRKILAEVADGKGGFSYQIDRASKKIMDLKNGEINLLEIVNKLIGEIDPIGETNEDNRRFENLKSMTKLVDQLLSEIDEIVIYNKDSHMYSKKRAAEFAAKFFDQIGIIE